MHQNRITSIASTHVITLNNACLFTEKLTINLPLLFFFRTMSTYQYEQDYAKPTRNRF